MQVLRRRLTISLRQPAVASDVVERLRAILQWSSEASGLARTGNRSINIKAVPAAGGIRMQLELQNTLCSVGFEV